MVSVRNTMPFSMFEHSELLEEQSKKLRYLWRAFSKFKSLHERLVPCNEAVTNYLTLASANIEWSVFPVKD